MRALDTVAAITGRDPEDTGGGCLVITYPHPTRSDYVVEVSEHDAARLDVAARHLDEDGGLCACDDGSTVWHREAVTVDGMLCAILEAHVAIVAHRCEVAR